MQLMDIAGWLAKEPSNKPAKAPFRRPSYTWALFPGAPCETLSSTRSLKYPCKDAWLLR